MSLLVIEFGVCHLSFLTWPSACSPYSLPREGAVQRGAPQRWRTEEAGAPAPALGGLPVASRSLPGSLPGAAGPVGRQGEGGRDGAIRVPVPTGLRPQHLPLHAVLLGTLPGCEEPRTSHVPVPRLPKSPPPHSCCQIDPVRILARSSGPSSLWRGSRAPHTYPRAQVDPPGLPKAKDLGGAGPDGPVPGTRPSPGGWRARTWWPHGEWPAGAHPERKADLP